MAGPQSSGPVPLFVFPRSALHATAVSRGDGIVPAAGGGGGGGTVYL